ncbi:MAG: metallophosphoesterase [Anaerolineales bacterium]
MQGQSPQIPPDREGGRSSFLHRLFIFTGWLSRIGPWKLLPTWLALALISGWAWPGHRVLVTLWALLFILGDGLTLALLPLARRSWGPVTPSLLALALLRTILSWLLAWLAPDLLLLYALVNTALTATVFYATWMEPVRLQVTEKECELPHGPVEHPLRLLHISDLHFEGLSPREQALLEKAESLKPDLILLTGDYLNLSSVHDPQAQEGARSLLSRLQAPLGVYAITGSPAVDVVGIVPEVFEGLEIRWLNDEATPIPWGEGQLWLLGVRCTTDLERDGAALKRLKERITPGEPTLLLYHSPDLMPEAAAAGIDLYLAGHTHGGQLRLPLFGALFTSSAYGKRYEMGRYEEAQTTLYVSRGLGLEGLGAPRARFLSPPEIILWTVHGTQHRREKDETRDQRQSGEFDTG